MHDLYVFIINVKLMIIIIIKKMLYQVMAVCAWTDVSNFDFRVFKMFRFKL